MTSMFIPNDAALLSSVKAKYGNALAVTPNCRHGQTFQVPRDADKFPEPLQEITMIAASLYEEIMEYSGDNSLVGGASNSIDIPLENPYWHATSTGNVHTPKNSTYYTICAILSMFLTRPECYSCLVSRRRHLAQEFLVSGINSTIYKHPDDPDESQTMMYFHCYIAVKIIVGDLYFDMDKPRDGRNLEIARGFLVGDTQVIDDGIKKELVGYDGTQAWVLGYFAEKCTCRCMDHLVRVVAATKAISESPVASRACVVCGKGEDVGGVKLSRCGRCKNEKEIYCGTVCQKKRWKAHKKECGPGTKKMEPEKKEKEGFISFDQYMQEDGGDLFKNPLEKMVQDGVVNLADLDFGDALDDLEIS